MVLENESAEETSVLFLGLNGAGRELGDSELGLGLGSAEVAAALLSPAGYLFSALVLLFTWVLGSVGNFIVIFLVVKNKQVMLSLNLSRRIPTKAHRLETHLTCRNLLLPSSALKIRVCFLSSNSIGFGNRKEEHSFHCFSFSSSRPYPSM
jgi:hypothetical protein